MLSRSRGLDLIALSLGCSINRVDSSIPPKLVSCVTDFILTQFSVLINQMPVKKLEQYKSWMTDMEAMASRPDLLRMKIGGS